MGAAGDQTDVTLPKVANAADRADNKLCDDPGIARTVGFSIRKQMVGDKAAPLLGGLVVPVDKRAGIGTEVCEGKIRLRAAGVAQHAYGSPCSLGCAADQDEAGGGSVETGSYMDARDI